MRIRPVHVGARRDLILSTPDIFPTILGTRLISLGDRGADIWGRMNLYVWRSNVQPLVPLQKFDAPQTGLLLLWLYIRRKNPESLRYLEPCERLYRVCLDALSMPVHEAESPSPLTVT